MSPRIVLEPKIDQHSDWLYKPTNIFKDSISSNVLSNETFKSYDTDGFIVVKNLFTKDSIVNARKELEEMTHSAKPQCESIYYEGAIRDYLPLSKSNDRKVKEPLNLENLALGQDSENLPAIAVNQRASFVRKFMGFVNNYPTLKEISNNENLLSVIQRILGEKGILFQDMAMIKPPKGREKPWHQDHAYFNYPLTTKIVGVWIALNDTEPSNGCMHVITGAHLNGPRIHFMKRDWQICDIEIRNANCTAVPMNTGDTMFFDSKLPHGTPTNYTNFQRWAIQLHYTKIASQKSNPDNRLKIFGSEGKNVSC